MFTYKKYLNKKYLIYLYALCNFSLKSIVIIIPILTQKIVDSAINNNFNKIIYYGSISLIITLILIFLMYNFSKIVVLIYAEIDYSLKKELAKRISFGNYTKINEKEIGYYIQRHNSDIEQSRFLYFEKNIDLVINILFFIGIFISMIRINLFLSAGLLITIPIFIFLKNIFIPKIENKAKEYSYQEEELNNSLETVYNNNHAARAMKFTALLFKKYDEQNQITKKSMLNYSLLDEKYDSIVVNGILNICLACIYFLGAIFVMKNIISVGELLAITIYFSRIWSPVEFFLGFKKKVSKAKVSEKRINQVLDLTTIENSKINKEDFNLLEIKNISFSYNKNRIFDNESIKLKNDNLYYIKGNNGSGKTTMFDIISGIINSNIEIIADDKKIKNTNSFIESNVFYIPSELFLISNLEYFDQETIDYIFPIKEKIDINKLSAGEKRIIQISSALKRKEKIIIIDEPLNYIGEKNIDYVLQMIERIKLNHIVIISSHNNEIMKITDKYYYIKNGKILVHN